ncbi:MAG TPA: discoidin domain-containing protein [Polyangiaceae bacterium]
MRSGVAVGAAALGGSLVFSGCALGTGEEAAGDESVGTISDALFCPGPTAFSATASAGAIQPAGNAIDGSTGTRWESAWADNQSITIDLNQIINLAAVTLNWETACGRDYDIEMAGDSGTNWSTFATIRGNTQAGVVTHEGWGHKIRYVRMKGITRCTQYGFSLWEFGVNRPSTKCYLDSDRDNQGLASAVSEVCASCPAGRVQSSSDCYDSNANAKAGQTSYFTTHRGDGSFDYNCNGVLDKQTVTSLSGCAAGSVYPNCIQATGVRPLVACGATVPIVACAAVPLGGPGSGGNCSGVSLPGPKQPCR